jgi:RNA polymerase sigma factor (sigma-70 family)
MESDVELLRRFANEGCEASFKELVARHVGLVHSTALRLVAGDTHLAQDVAQVVFIDLARKAAVLPREVVLAGWLHEATRFAAAKALRIEHRRQAREREAVAMQDPVAEKPSDADTLRPVLDAAMGELNSTERDALVLRFFNGQDFRSVGAALGISDDAAQKRVQRALEKLRVVLQHRGFHLPLAALETALVGAVAGSAPAGLAGSIATVALATAAKTAAPGLASGLLGLTTAAKAKVALAAALAAVLAAPLFLQYRANEALREENVALRARTESLGELEKLREENQRLARNQVEATEVWQARSNHLELLKLRGEHAQLLQLRQEVERLRASLSARATPDSRPDLQEQMETGKKVSCLNNLRQLCLATIMYADDHQGGFPNAARWCEALQPYHKDPRFLRCPSDPDRPCGYAFNAKLSSLSETNVATPSETVLLFEADAGLNGAGGPDQAVARHGDTVIVAFADGSCRGIKKDRLGDLIWDPAAAR